MSFKKILRRISVILRFGAIASLALTARAADASDYLGYVQSVVQIGSTTWVYIGGGHFGTDNCGTNRTQLVLYTDPTTPTGKSYIALAVSAKLSGNQVYAAGNNTCYTGNTPNGGTSESMTVMWLQ